MAKKKAKKKNSKLKAKKSIFGLSQRAVILLIITVGALGVGFYALALAWEKDENVRIFPDADVGTRGYCLIQLSGSLGSEYVWTSSVNDVELCMFKSPVLRSGWSQDNNINAEVCVYVRNVIAHSFNNFKKNAHFVVSITSKKSGRVAYRTFENNSADFTKQCLNYTFGQSDVTVLSPISQLNPFVPKVLYYEVRVNATQNAIQMEKVEVSFK